MARWWLRLVLEMFQCYRISVQTYGVTCHRGFLLDLVAWEWFGIILDSWAMRLPISGPSVDTWVDARQWIVHESTHEQFMCQHMTVNSAWVDTWTGQHMNCSCVNTWQDFCTNPKKLFLFRNFSIFFIIGGWGYGTVWEMRWEDFGVVELQSTQNYFFNLCNPLLNSLPLLTLFHF